MQLFKLNTFIVFFLLLILLSENSLAQLNKWLVRETSGQVHLVDFTTPNPTVSIPSSGYGNGGLEDVNVMTDINSNILFTTAARTGGIILVKDAAWNTMPNGTGLKGNISSLSSALCPRPCSGNQYFFVHYESQDIGISDSLYYSIIDMSLNGGSGDVIQKNIVLGSGYSEGLAFSHQIPTGCRWLLVGAINNNIYSIIRFLVSDAGISGPTVIGTYSVNSNIAGRPIKVTMAHDNSKIAMSTLRTNSADADIVVWDFDLLSGTLSNQQLFNVSTQGVLGIEFSPDNSKIYYLTNISGSSIAHLGRVDVVTGNNEVISSTMGAYSNDIQLAGNGRLYVSWNSSGKYLSEIANPNSSTLAGIGFTSQAVLISNSGCRPGLPNTIDGELPGSTVTPQFIEFSGEATVNCNEFTFRDSTCLGTWREWDFGDGTFSNVELPVHQYSTAGVFDVTLRVLACGDTITLTKPDYITTSFTNPAAEFNFTNNSCAGTMVSFINASAGASDYLWNFGDGDSSTAINPLHVFSSGGTYTITLISTLPSCGSDTIQHQITIMPNPVILADFDYSVIQCTDSLILNNQSLNSTTYLWDFGDGNTSSVISPFHIYNSDGVYTIRLVAANACSSDTLHEQITINTNAPVSAFSLASQPCDLTVGLLDQSQNSSTYLWDFGDGTTLPGNVAFHTYQDTGAYSITLIAYNLCGSDTATHNLTVIPQAQAGLTFSIDSCAMSVNFTDSSIFNSGVLWDFGDGTSSNVTNAIHNYNSPGTYTITLIALSSLCDADTIEQQLTIPDPFIQADFSFSVIPCTDTLILVNESINSTSYYWDFGDGVTSATSEPVHNYNSYGSFIVKLIATNTCSSDTLQQPVNISLDNAVAAFTANVQPCNFMVGLSNQSQNGLFYTWDFGDGSIQTGNISSHTYSGTGEYLITLITSNACTSDTITDSLLILGDALADFNFNIDSCSGIVQMINNSESASSYIWNFGNGDTSIAVNPVHVYNSTGNFIITLIAANSCSSDTLQAQINIANDTVIASFVAVAEPCDYTIGLLNQSQSGVSYQWNFGDGISEVGNISSHTYPGTGEYLITLIASNSCTTDTIVDSLFILNNAVAAFDLSIDSCSGEINMYNHSENASSYLWNFGDGTASDIENPIHLYNAEGIYTVTLIVNASSPCSDTLMQTINYLPATLDIGFTVPNCFTPDHDGINEVFKINHNLKCDQPIFTIFNRWGEKLFKTSENMNYWDGTYRGKLVPSGTYFYIIEYGSGSQAGTVTLIY